MKMQLCVHIVCVCDYVCQASNESLLGFTYRDIVVQWTHAYIHLKNKTTTPKIISQVFNALVCSDIKGPRIQYPISNRIEIEERFPLEIQN